MNDGGDCRTAPATPGLLTNCVLITLYPVQDGLSGLKYERKKDFFYKVLLYLLLFQSEYELLNSLSLFSSLVLIPTSHSCLYI